MPSFELIDILPFWILGLPLLIAIFSIGRGPRAGDRIPPDRRFERHNLTRETHIRAGDTVISRG